MFIHAVLFEIKRKEVPYYRKDSIMWATHAKKHSKGFVSYYTMKRADVRNQYVSVYKWKTRNHHEVNTMAEPSAKVMNRRERAHATMMMRSASVMEIQ